MSQPAPGVSKGSWPQWIAVTLTAAGLAGGLVILVLSAFFVSRADFKDLQSKQSDSAEELIRLRAERTADRMAMSASASTLQLMATKVEGVRVDVAGLRAVCSRP